MTSKRGCQERVLGELTSCSNCGDYQSRRLGIRYNDDQEGRLKHVSTLNGTCMAVPRVIIVALIEQNFNAERMKFQYQKFCSHSWMAKDKIVLINVNIKL